MLRDILLICISILLAKIMYRKPLKETEVQEKNYHKKAGILTYDFFMKWGTNDEEMKRLLIANEQDLKEFEGYSRRHICEKMKWKAELTGKTYTRKPM